MADIPSDFTAGVASSREPAGRFKGLIRRYREFAQISRDPVLFISLLFCGLFLFIFVFLPLVRAIGSGFFPRKAFLT